jgi:acid phosphatase
VADLLETGALCSINLRPLRCFADIRTRFGDETIRVPACAAKGKHLTTTSADGVEQSHPEFCTLEAFLELTRALKNPDGLTWAQECSLARKAISSK